MAPRARQRMGRAHSRKRLKVKQVELFEPFPLIIKEKDQSSLGPAPGRFSPRKRVPLRHSQWAQKCEIQHTLGHLGPGGLTPAPYVPILMDKRRCGIEQRGGSSVTRGGCVESIDTSGGRAILQSGGLARLPKRGFSTALQKGGLSGELGLDLASAERLSSPLMLWLREGEIRGNSHYSEAAVPVAGSRMNPEGGWFGRWPNPRGDRRVDDTHFVFETGFRS